MAYIAGTGGAETLNGGPAADEIVSFGGNDTLNGAGGNDTLDGGNGADSLIGGLGNDSYYVNIASDVVHELAGEGAEDLINTYVSYTLPDEVEELLLRGAADINGTGNALDNTLTGNIAHNLLNGGGGDDILIGGGGRDTLKGGTGDDTYYVDSAPDVIIELVGAGAQDLIISTVSYTLPDEVEWLGLGGTANISGTGNELDNAILGNSGNNLLNGGSGDDLLFGDLGSDTLEGGNGSDALEGDSGSDSLVGGSGSDMLTGGDGDDLLDGGGGDDTLSGGAGNDTLNGGAGNDTYELNSASDVINELAGEGPKDLIHTSVSCSLPDEVEELFLEGTANIKGTGNTLDNTIFGNSGNNRLAGGAGDDILFGQLGDDYLHGGPGMDGVGYLTAEHGVTVDLAAGVASGGEGSDTLVSVEEAAGSDYDDALTGTAGKNVLVGFAGNDTLDGGAGNDTISGGAGSDRLTGRGGQDNFEFSDALDATTNVDRITDFVVIDDTIHLVDTIFSGTATEQLAAGRFYSAPGATEAHDSTDRIVYNSDTGKLYYDADGTGATSSAILFATLSGAPTLTNADFLIVT